jgi:hypothetical protein
MQNTTHTTKDWAARTPLNTEGELGCPGRVSSPCPTVPGIRRVTLVTIPVIRLYDDRINHDDPNRNMFRNINCGIPAFADDIALLALSPTSLHTHRCLWSIVFLTEFTCLHIQRDVYGFIPDVFKLLKNTSLKINLMIDWLVFGV